MPGSRDKTTASGRDFNSRAMDDIHSPPLFFPSDKSLRRQWKRCYYKLIPFGCGHVTSNSLTAPEHTQQIKKREVQGEAAETEISVQTFPSRIYPPCVEVNTRLTKNQCKRKMGNLRRMVKMLLLLLLLLLLGGDVFRYVLLQMAVMTVTDADDARRRMMVMDWHLLLLLLAGFRCRRDGRKSGNQRHHLMPLVLMILLLLLNLLVLLMMVHLLVVTIGWWILTATVHVATVVTYKKNKTYKCRPTLI